MTKKDFEKIAAFFRNAASLVYKEEDLTIDEIFYLWQNLFFLSEKAKDLAGKIEQFWLYKKGEKNDLSLGNSTKN